MMVQHEPTSADEHTDVGGLAWVLLGMPAGTVEQDNARRSLENDVSRGRVRDDLVEIGPLDVMI